MNACKVIEIHIATDYMNLLKLRLHSNDINLRLSRKIENCTMLE